MYGYYKIIKEASENNQKQSENNAMNCRPTSKKTNEEQVLSMAVIVTVKFPMKLKNSYEIKVTHYKC